MRDASFNHQPQNDRDSIFIIVISIYLLLHFLIRIVFSQTFQVDDAEQIRLAQTFALGYPIPQPPLYSWLAWTLFQLFGSSLFSLTLLKYLLIGLTFWFIWLSSNYLFRHKQTNWLATTSFLLMPSFAWHMHQGFTHTILLGFSIAMSLHALLKLHHYMRTRDYLYLGVALGTGMMAKYSFILFMLPLLLSTLTVREYRKFLIHPGIFLTLTTLFLVTAPHIFWLTQHHHEIFNTIDQKLQVSGDNPIFERLLSLWNFITSATAFVTPWIIIFAVLTGKRLFSSRPTQRAPSSYLLSRFYWAIILSIVLLSLFLAMPHFKVRWFHPLMMLFPLWWLTYIESDTPLPKQSIHWIRRITVALSILILSIRIIQLTIGPELGYHSRLNRPIIETLTKLSNIPRSTQLVTEDPFLGAHLLSYYSDIPVTIGNRTYRRNSTISVTACIQIWDNDDSYSEPSPSESMNIETFHTQVANKRYTLHLKYLPSELCATTGK